MKADVKQEVLKTISLKLVNKEQLEKELDLLTETQMLTVENLGYESLEIAEEIKLRKELLETINN